MKNLIYIFAISFLFPVLSKSQVVNQGIVHFTTTTTDTVNNIIINLPDSIRYTYYFKSKNFRIQYGTDSINNSFIINTQGRYSLDVMHGIKTYLHDTLTLGIDSLINSWDTTSIRYMLTSEHRSILGYYCTKGYFFFLSDSEASKGDTTAMIAFWYTDQIFGNNYIPGASATTLNLNGLILSYEIPVTNGIQTVSPISISTDPIDDNIFFPDLTGYINRRNSGGN